MLVDIKLWKDPFLRYPINIILHVVMNVHFKRPQFRIDKRLMQMSNICLMHGKAVKPGPSNKTYSIRNDNNH